MTTKHKCCGKKWTGFSHASCGNNAKVERDGKWYCGTHDPVAIKQKRDAQNAKFEAQYKEKESKWEARTKANAEIGRRAGCYDPMLAALQAILPFIPKSSESEGGAAKYSEAVKAADLVRAAIAKATENNSTPHNQNAGYSPKTP